MLRLALAAVLLVAQMVRAAECEDVFSECKEDCLIEHGGSIRVEEKKRYAKCMKKCVRAANTCQEREEVTRSSDLDEGALDEPKKAPARRKELPGTDDDPPEQPAEPADAPTPAAKTAEADQSPPVRSSRTVLKEDAPARAEKERPAATTKASAEPAPPPPAKAEAPASSSEREPEPPRRTREKEPPKKKEEDHDDLRFY